MNDFIIVIITLLFSFYFSGTEIAFVSSNRLKIALDNQQGKRSARFYMKMISQPYHFIGTMLLGNNIALVIYGIAMAKILEQPIVLALPTGMNNPFWLLVFQTLISTLIVLILAEFLPKALFRISPNKSLDIVAYPSMFFHFLFYPVVKIISRFSEWFLKKILGIKFTTTEPVFGKSDLEEYISEAANQVQHDSEYKQEIQMFQNAMEFPTIKVRECMVPRNEVVAIEKSESIDSLKKLFIETELSRIPVYEESIDNIVGYIHSHNMFYNPPNIESAIIPIPIVPETMLVSKLLKVFIQQKKSIAVVVDEFGGTSGIVTMEDIIEEIFGEIEDEHDVDDFVEKKISNNEYLFSGRLEIDYLNQEYNLDIPVSEEYETLAGFIIHHHEDIPQKNEEIKIGRFTFVITAVSQTQILQVRMLVDED